MDPDQLASEEESLYIWFHTVFIRTCILSGLQIRVCIGKLFSLFLTQNICCGNSKKPRLNEAVLLSTKTYV